MFYYNGGYLQKLQHDCAYLDLKEAEQLCHSRLLINRLIFTTLLMLAA
jgi:hypothetical protein